MAERKRYLEIVLMPLVLAVVGTLGTYFITEQQRQASQAAAEAQREAAAARSVADRQLQILEIFADKITSPDEVERSLAVYSTLALDPDLASKLLPAFLVAREQAPDTVKEKTPQSPVDLRPEPVGDIVGQGTEPEDFSLYRSTLTWVADAIVLRRVTPRGAVASIDGTWLLLRSDELRPDFENPLHLTLNESGELVARGDGWQGKGAFDGRHGYYDWVFSKKSGLAGATGRTRIYLNEAGLLYGHVKGSGLNWTYWGYPVTKVPPRLAR